VAAVNPPESVALAVLVALVLTRWLESGMPAHPGMRWLVTTSNQHRIHHSLDPAQRESNFACNAIVWDRVFGTYRDGPVQATGLGPRVPGLRRSLVLPFRP